MGGSWKEDLKAWSREVREGSLEEGGQAESPGLTRRSQAEQAWQRLACLQLREETDKAGPDPTCQQGPRSVATARPGVDKVLGRRGVGPVSRDTEARCEDSTWLLGNHPLLRAHIPGSQ